MKQFEVVTKDGHKIDFDFPNSIKEISEQYLDDITKSINIADNYSLIALCYSDVLSRVILTARTGNKNAKIKVTPIFVKAGNTDSEFIKNAKTKQRVICMNSQLSLGVHVTLPHHKLTLDYFVSAVTNTNDKEIYDKELAKGDTREVIFIEFKLVPNSDINGLLDIDVPAINNNYITVNKLSECGEQ